MVYGKTVEDLVDAAVAALGAYIGGEVVLTEPGGRQPHDEPVPEGRKVMWVNREWFRGRLGDVRPLHIYGQAEPFAWEGVLDWPL